MGCAISLAVKRNWIPGGTRNTHAQTMHVHHIYAVAGESRVACAMFAVGEAVWC